MTATERTATAISSRVTVSAIKIAAAIPPSQRAISVLKSPALAKAVTEPSTFDDGDALSQFDP